MLLTKSPVELNADYNHQLFIMICVRSNECIYIALLQIEVNCPQP